MAEAGLQTVPNYLNIGVDTPITFELVAEHQEGSASQKIEEVATPEFTGSQAPDNSAEAISADDPSFRIGQIESARKPPVSVKPNASLKEAMTLMLVRSFSQVPVMTNEREVKGVVSWASIGARLATNSKGVDVQAYMDNHHELNISASLFSAIKIIRDHNYVLTRSNDNKIAGIVTADDIALEFEKISTPFLLLAEIENNLRSMINSKLSLADIKMACSEEHLPKGFTKVSDLTFGNYVRVLENTENWSKLHLELDRTTLCSELSEINKIRNDVMHFDPEPLHSDDLRKLQNMARMFDMLRNLGAF